MLFQKRVDRAMKYSKEKADENQREILLRDDREEFLSERLEKGDIPALLISGLIVFLPASMIVVALMCFLGMFPAFF